jgi:hypothetical protein
LYFLWFDVIFLSGAGIWTNLLLLGRHYHWSHTPFFALVIFQIGSFIFCPGPALNHDPPSYASHIAGWQVCSTTARVVGWDGVSLTFCWAGLKPWSSQSLPPKYLGLDMSHVPGWICCHFISLFSSPLKPVLTLDILSLPSSEEMWKGI